MKQLVTDAVRRKHAVSATSKYLLQGLHSCTLLTDLCREVSQLQEQVATQQSQLQSCEMNEQQVPLLLAVFLVSRPH